MTRLVTLLAISVIALSSLPNFAAAHENATGVVKERMKAMETIGKSMKQLALLIRGKQPYQSGEIKKHALIIQNHGGEHLTMLFPNGSTDMPSEARPEIWKNWDEFSALAESLSDTAGALSKAGIQGASPTNDRVLGSKSVVEAGQLSSKSPQVLFMELAKTCKSCHKSYRQKK